MTEHCPFCRNRTALSDAEKFVFNRTSQGSSRLTLSSGKGSELVAVSPSSQVEANDPAFFQFRLVTAIAKLIEEYIEFNYQRNRDAEEQFKRWKDNF